MDLVRPDGPFIAFSNDAWFGAPLNIEGQANCQITHSSNLAGRTH